MRRERFYFLIIILLVCIFPQGAKAQEDSVDVIDYSIKLDVGRMESKKLIGSAKIQLQLLRQIDAVDFSLRSATVDSVKVNNSLTTDYVYLRNKVTIPTSGMNPNSPFEVEIFYNTKGYVETAGWGGFHFNNNIYYNLGVAFGETPHCIGRAWFPCRDNFTDKATYTFNITTKIGWKASCSGILQSRTLNDDGSETSVWRLDIPTPTYLVSITTANLKTIQRDFQGIYGTYPAMISFLTYDSVGVERAFDILEDAIPAYEKRFGPYRWDRIGYVSTPLGSMEHVNNISFASDCINSTDLPCQTMLVHELGHAWFGNLVTCAVSGDMWFNEGGATFCEEVVLEDAFGKDFSNHYYETMLDEVLRTAHIDDNGYIAVQGVTRNNTYGTTVYKKGGMVWHSLRGYMGDSVYYACMRRLFNEKAFGNITSAELCQKLSDFSGMNLTKFFDFHVFKSGFVDYRIEWLDSSNDTTTIGIRQKLIGTNEFAQGNRVPVTFFSSEGDTLSKLVCFDGEYGENKFILPFTPKMAVVDLYKTLSDGAIGNLVAIPADTTLAMPLSHISIISGSEINNNVYVVHHTAVPDADPNPGIVSIANRYWSINSLNELHALKARFYFNFTTSGEDAYLDNGWENNGNATLGIVYKKNPWDRWSLVRSSLYGSTKGYLEIDTLKAGEYALAFLDLPNLDIQEPMKDEICVSIAPNPASNNFRIFAEDCDGTFDIDIISTQGVIQQSRNIRNGEAIQTQIPSGHYILSIEDRASHKKINKSIVIVNN